uniref:Uncharacterized protein n=1 Tax=Arundo donax TaxID=35708 RepID=A0A0A9A7A3_ARUDO
MESSSGRVLGWPMEAIAGDGSRQGEEAGGAALGSQPCACPLRSGVRVLCAEDVDDGALHSRSR